MSGLLPEPAGYAELLEQLKARVRLSHFLIVVVALLAAQGVMKLLNGASN